MANRHRQRPALPRTIRPTALSATLLCSVLGAVALPIAAHAQSTPAAAERRSYDLPAGTLDQVLGSFGQAAGVMLAIDPALTAGLRSDGLRGSHTVPEALRALLAPHGLEAVSGAGGGWRLRKAEAPAAAATEHHAPALPRVKVTARALADEAGGPVTGFVATRSATGTKTDTALVETPQSISVVTRDELDARGVQGMTEALRYVGGVSVDNWGFEARGYEWVLLRGFEARDSGNYRDGLVQPLFVDASFRTEPYGIERVEVLRGPASVLFGQGDAGGIVNRITKQPRADAVREVELQAGNFGRRQAAADVGGALDAQGNLLYRVVGLALDSGTQIRYPGAGRLETQRRYLAPSLRWEPQAGTRVTLNADLLHDETGDDASYVIGADRRPTRVLEGDPRYSRLERDQRSFGWQAEHRIAEGWTLRQNARIASADVVKHHMRTRLATDGRTLLRTARLEDTALRQTAVDTHLQADLRTGDIAHVLLAGLDWSRVHGSTRSLTGPAPDLDLLAPVYGQPIAEPTLLGADYTQTNTQLGVYLQDQLRFGERWLLTLGGRSDRVEGRTRNRRNPAAAPTTKEDDAFSGRAALSYRFAGGFVPYASYAESFQPQSGVDRAGRAFEPTRGRQVELGLKFQPADGRSLFTASLFNLRKSRVLTPDQDDPSQSVQTGAIRSRGLELEARTELSPGLSAVAALTWNDVEVTASNGPDLGRMPIQIPRVSGAFWLDYALAQHGLKGWSTGLGVRHVGSRYDDQENKTSSDAFTLVDAAVRWDGGPWRAALNVSNLFDKRYVASRAYGGYYPGSERTIAATLRYRW